MSKSQSKISEYPDYCLLCGRPSTDKHHLLMGSDRKNADIDGLYIMTCRECHNFIHQHPQAVVMSKIIGQLAYEREHTREEFRSRYRHSYL
jgi:Zn-finger protein